jgi:precorrin-3B methylase
LERLAQAQERIVVIASNVGRLKEHITVTTTTDLIAQGIDHPDVTMSTLILVGNSTTRRTKNGWVLTPRGYLNKYDLEGELR